MSTVISRPGWLSFDQMSWPRAGKLASELQWRLRYGVGDLIAQSDRLAAAEIINAYHSLVHATDAKRRLVVRTLRRAELTQADDK